MTKVRTYRIDVDECAQQGDAIVVGTCGGMTSKHLGTVASLDSGTCAGNVPVLDINGELPASVTPSSAMKKCVYDPDNKQADVYDYRNFDNTPEIPVVNNGIVSFVQGGVNKGSISLNQAGNTTITLMAGGLDAGKGTNINCNCIDVNVDGNSVNIDTCNNLCVVDYDTIKCGAAAGLTAIQPSDLASVNNLQNYYLKCETYQKCEVDNLISNFGGFEVVTTLPTENIKTNVIYLKGPIGTGADRYEEWIYYNNNWTKIGETSVDLSNYALKCELPTDNCQLTNGCGYTTCTGTLVENDLAPYTKTCDLSNVAISGQYCDLTGTPTIPAALSAGIGVSIVDNCINVLYDNNTIKKDSGNCLYADFSGLATTASLCTVATSGKYCDLTGQPTIPTDNCQLANSCGYTTCTGTVVASDLNAYAKSCNLCTVATSGKYCDLTNTPVLCAVATSGKYCDLTDAPDISDVNTKTFTLSSTSDTTNATAALTHITGGGNAIILYNNVSYNLASKSSSSLVFKSNPTITANTSDTTINVPTLTFTVSGDAVTAISSTNTSIGKYLETDRNYGTVYTPTYNGSPATKKYVDDAVSGAGGGDMCYSDYNWASKSGASITLDLNSTITPSANFTVNKPSTIKEGQTYVLRVNNGSTAYTMTLGTGISNPRGTDLTLTPDGTDMFIFLATNSSTLELQNDVDDEVRFVTQEEYNALPSTKETDGRAYFIVEEAE